jgi:excisionase family DNA binding protein
MFAALIYLAIVIVALFGTGLGMAATAAVDPAKDDVVRDGFASVEQAEEFLRLGRSTVYKLMESGELIYAQFGRSRRIPWRAIREYAAKQLVG